MKRIAVCIACLVVFASTGANGQDKRAPGNPLSQIQEQIDQINQQLSSIKNSTGAGGIKVYDANGQYLGLHLGRSKAASSSYDGIPASQIYIPSIQKEVYISNADGDICVPPLMGEGMQMCYENAGCTGAAFIWSPLGNMISRYVRTPGPLAPQKYIYTEEVPEFVVARSFQDVNWDGEQFFFCML